ncbi:MAG: DUF3883 domain-containing protein [Alistipes sp.]|nr:DUF3883 domain-containing protein [Alistipes sp.]
MSYNPDNQYRCTIIRGKSQNEMEDLLPMYANMVHRFCPCSKSEFDERGNRFLSKVLFGTEQYDSLPDSNRKTVRNHLTEIAGTLLALYRTGQDGYVYETELCSFLLSTNDFPAYFRNLCLNFQFPNGTKKVNHVLQDISNGINIKPYCYVVSLLYYAQLQVQKLLLTKQEVGYYVLNNLDVLQGKVDISVVYAQIIYDRQHNVIKDKLSGSHDWQHIKEQFNLLELANIVCTDKNYIWLNKDETAAIQVFIKSCNTNQFDVYSYDLSSIDDRSQFYADWEQYYGRLNSELAALPTTFNSEENIVIADRQSQLAQRGSVGASTIDIGDRGETLVYNLERERVGNYKPRLVNKVLLLGKTKGLGYDISSIEADENPAKPEFARYIEVKATTRITEPSFDEFWTDSLNLTQKEWVAAEQYRDYYNIYRVYFTKAKTLIVRIKNPYDLATKDMIEVYPTTYQMNFNDKVLEHRYAGE